MALQNDKNQDVATQSTLIDLARSSSRGSNRTARNTNVDRGNLENWQFNSYGYRSYAGDVGVMTGAAVSLWNGNAVAALVDQRQQLQDITRTVAILRHRRWDYS